MKKNSIITSACLFVALGITIAFSSTVAAKKKNEPTFTMDFNNVSVGDLIKTMSKMTGKNFMIDQSVGGTITLIAPEPVTLDEAWRIFLSVLETKNLTLEPVVGKKMHRVVVAREGPQRNIPHYYGKRKGPESEQMIVRLIPLDYAKPTDIEALLKTFKGRNGQMITYAPANMLILVDTSSHINVLLDMIYRLDKPAELGSTKFIEIEYASATEIVNLLKQVYGLNEGAAKPTRRGRKAAVAQTQGYETRALVDARTNQIILIGPKTEIEEINDFIVKFDRPVVSGKGQIHVYYLRNADATSLSETLSRLTQNVGKAPAKGQKGQTNSVANFEGGVRITSDKDTNSLIITSSSADFVRLQALINKLDRPRQQVYVEAAIVEVYLTNNLELGMNLTIGQEKEILGEQGLVFGGLGLGGMSSILDPTALASINGIFGGAAIIPTGLDLPPLGLILRALSTADNVNILSTPHLLTSDNQEAEIVVGDNVPFITGQSATSGGNLVTTVDRRDVGLTLRIKPQINESNRIKLEIYQEISSVSPQQPQGLDVNKQGLITRKRSAKTTVVANDRQTIAIGGLIANENSESVNKVPFLGDLPIIGRLFRSTKKAAKKTNLMIFLTPTVVRNALDYGTYADAFIQKFRKLERRVPSAAVDYEEFFNEHNTGAVYDQDPLATADSPASIENGGVVDTSEFKQKGTDETIAEEADLERLPVTNPTDMPVAISNETEADETDLERLPVTNPTEIPPAVSEPTVVDEVPVP